MLPLKLSSFLNEDFIKFFLMLMMLRIIFNGINATDTMSPRLNLALVSPSTDPVKINADRLT